METLKEGTTEVSVNELVKLGAVDTMLFNRSFFPRAFRQASPSFHPKMIRTFENPKNRFSDFMCYRGSAKTTLFRGLTAKRIAYGLSRTIVYTSATQGHAAKSVGWLRKQIEHNRMFADTFQLRPGKTWNNEAIEIYHGVEQVPIWVLATGITGQNRGLNLDDFRPDLILVDDPCDEENTNTPEQRKKIADLFFGTLQNSLAPASECPDAKMVLAQTILHPDDLVSMCHRDPQWASERYSCFDDEGESAWPERWSTAELREMRQGYISRNQLSLWMREMECKIVSDETSAFHAEWLNFYEAASLPEGMVTFMAIDPASSDSKTADYQVIAAIGYHRGKFYLLEYSMARGQDPEQTASEFFRMADKWRPLYTAVEIVAYQRVLSWYLKREMERRGRFFAIQEIQDRRKKSDRIRQNFIAATSDSRFFCRDDQTEFIEQFSQYPDVKHDDLLDSISMAIQIALPVVANLADQDYDQLMEDTKVTRLSDWRSAP